MFEDDKQVYIRVVIRLTAGKRPVEDHLERVEPLDHPLDDGRQPLFESFPFVEKETLPICARLSHAPHSNGGLGRGLRYIQQLLQVVVDADLGEAGLLFKGTPDIARLGSVVAVHLYESEDEVLGLV